MTSYIQCSAQIYCFYLYGYIYRILYIQYVYPQYYFIDLRNDVISTINSMIINLMKYCDIRCIEMLK